MGRQDKEFWRYIKDFDFMSLCETWTEEKGWNRIKDSLSDSHSWYCIFAKREKRKGRAKGGFIIGKKKDWGKVGDFLGKEVEEGILMSKVKNGGGRKDIVIVSVYNSGDWGRLEKSVKLAMKEGKENAVILGGDFNIRIGTEGGCKEGEGGW